MSAQLVTVTPLPLQVSGSVSVNNEIEVSGAVTVSVSNSPGMIGDLSGESVFAPSSPGVTPAYSNFWQNVTSTWNQVSSCTMAQHKYQAVDGGRYPVVFTPTCRPDEDNWSDRATRASLWRFQAYSIGAGASVDAYLTVPALVIVRVYTLGASDVWYATGGDAPYKAYTIGSAGIRSWYTADSTIAPWRLYVTTVGGDPLTESAQAIVYFHWLEKYEVTDVVTNYEDYELTLTSGPFFPELRACKSNALVNRAATIANSLSYFSQQYPSTYNINT